MIRADASRSALVAPAHKQMKITCGLFRRIERMAPEIKDSLAVTYGG